MHIVSNMGDRLIFCRDFCITYRVVWRLSTFGSGALPAGVVNGIGLGEDDLGDWDKGEARLEQLLQNPGEGLRGVFGRVVE